MIFMYPIQYRSQTLMSHECLALCMFLTLSSYREWCFRYICDCKCIPCFLSITTNKRGKEECKEYLIWLIMTQS